MADALLRVLVAAERLDDGFALVLQQSSDQPPLPEVDQLVAGLWLTLAAASVACRDEGMLGQVGGGWQLLLCWGQVAAVCHQPSPTAEHAPYITCELAVWQ